VRMERQAVSPSKPHSSLLPTVEVCQVNADTTKSSLRITVKPAGIIRMYVREQEMDVPAGFTSAALIEQLGIPSQLRMLSLVNGTKRPLDAELDDGDEVRLVTLVYGG